LDKFLGEYTGIKRHMLFAGLFPAAIVGEAPFFASH
jgi:hypothetical protein